MKKVRFEGGKMVIADIIIEVRFSVDYSNHFKVYDFTEHEKETLGSRSIAEYDH